MDQEMDSAAERQKSRPKTRYGSLIHCFTKLWNVGLIPSACAAYHRSNEDEGLRLGSRPTDFRLTAREIILVRSPQRFEPTESG